MESIVKKVLKKIENNGYEAYLVGGYVRDLILGHISHDIDICTNALPKDLVRIFPNSTNNKYGGINFKIKKFNFDITTYRKELKYASRKPIEIEYVNNLFDDIKRRDFSINALCMNSKGYVIDLVNGVEDLKNKVIRCIGDVNVKFTEDPLRILRAIRFMTILDFELDGKCLKAIEENKALILTLSNERIRDELDKILTNKNADMGLNLLNKFGILNILNISYSGIKNVEDLLGMWSQLNFEFNSAFTKEEKRNIINIRKILNKKVIDESILFKYGLYQSIVAGEILGVSKLQINNIYKRMAIHSKKELNITAIDIMNILEINPGSIINVILDEIIFEILNKKLKNNYTQIKRFILAKKEKWLI